MVKTDPDANRSRVCTCVVTKHVHTPATPAERHPPGYPCAVGRIIKYAALFMAYLRYRIICTGRLNLGTHLHYIRTRSPTTPPGVYWALMATFFSCSRNQPTPRVTPSCRVHSGS